MLDQKRLNGKDITLQRFIKIQMYQIEKNGPFSTTLKYLMIMRQVPTSMDKNYLKKFYATYLLSKSVSICGTAVGPILFLVNSLMSDSEIDITEAISMTFAGTGGSLVCLLFTLKYKEWSDFFINLVDTTRFGKPMKYDQTVNLLNRYGNIGCFSFSWVTIIYLLADLYSSKGCKNVEGICPTFIPIWLPFDATGIVAGAIVFTLQTFFIGVLVAQPFLMECFLMYESTELLICHIGHLKDHLKKTFEASSALEMRDNLRRCVDYHNHIFKLGYKLGSLIKYTAGHMSLLSALVCGCVANQLMNTKPIGSLIFLTAWLFALFCFCHSGQRIKDETMSIGDALWNSKWYKTDARTMKDVKFILMRCQKPICFEALPLGITDYAFYFMMIKTGYSYFALLNQSL